MNNNMGPIEGQNLNPSGTPNSGVEALSQPSLGGTVPPVAPVQGVGTPPVTPVAPVSSPTLNVSPVVNVEPLPSVAPTPAPVAQPVQPIENLNSSPITPEPVTPVTQTPVAESLNSNANSQEVTPVTPVVPVPTVVQPVTPNATVVPPTTNAPENNTQTPPTQPTLDNNVSPSGTPNDKPKGKNMKPAIIGIVLVLVVAVVGIVGMKFLGNKKSNDNNNNQISQGQTTQVNFGGYTFTLPETMTYSFEEDALMIISTDYKWTAEIIGPIVGNYNILKENKSTIETTLTNNGKANSVSKGDVKTYEGVEYLTFEADFAGMKGLVAYSPFSSNAVLGIVAFSESNQFDYGILEALTPVISSAKEHSLSNAMELPKDNSILDILKDQIAESEQDTDEDTKENSTQDEDTKQE